MGFSANAFSSYYAYGTYTVKDDEVILTTSDFKYQYHFQIKDNTLVFAEDGSVFVWKRPLLVVAEVHDVLPEEPVGMRIFNISPIGATIEIYNYSEETLLYGDDYYLWKSTEDGQWEILPRLTEAALYMTGYMVEADSTVSLDLSWEWLYGSLPDGHYQIEKYVSSESSTDSAEEKLRIVATFDIGGWDE